MPVPERQLVLQRSDEMSLDLQEFNTMTTTKKRAPSSVLVQKDSIDQAGSLLLQLPEKPKEAWSLREAINLLQDSISGALQRGYTYEEIAAMLSDKGVKISPSSLKSYLAASRKEKSGSSRGRKVTRGKRKASPATSPAAIAEPVAPPPAPVEQPVETAPAPKKRGPRSTTATRPRTAAKAQTKASTRATPTRTTKKTDTKPARGRKPKEA